jgi:7-carboxy-7-deazaguanine synthase
VQGEGFWTGSSAFFLRLGGCDVYCPWCDQKESWNAHRYPQQSVEELVEMAKRANPAMVVITGGEPLMHNLEPLTFSPKTYKMPDPSIYSQVNELKIVVANSQDLDWAALQESQLSKGVIKYLQPEWNRVESKELVFNYVLHHPQWRVSLKTHKFLGVR